MLAVSAAIALMPAARLIGLSPNLTYPAKGLTEVRTFGPFNPNLDFDEAVVSWNVKNPGAAALKVQVRATIDGHKTNWYTLGDWAGDASLHARQSVGHQSDADGEVQTDTLHLNKPAQKLELSVEMQTLAEGPLPRLSLLTVCFSNTSVTGLFSGKPSRAWGVVADCPERAQGNYPNGGVLCSPTSVSMVLWALSQQLQRPDLNKDVPDVEAGVWDSAFKGAGNWPFNTAYAGGFDGVTAYVARFNAISDLEEWTEFGRPVICSVSFDLLRGLPLSPQESGHLVVLCGFTANGDPVINDPAFKHEVHRTYKREDFDKAWSYSHRTVYLIYPDNTALPPNKDGLWLNP